MKKIAFVAAAALTVTAASAQAADLGRRPAPAPAVVEPVAMLWNGFYIGAHAGYGWGTVSGTSLGTALNPRISQEGFFGGGQVGYNWQMPSNWVIGVEADVSGADMRGTQINGLVTTTNRMDLFGTVRGRLGYAFGNMLLYGTGGYAWGDNRVSSPGFGSTTHFLSGYAAGAGLEWAFSPNWSAKLEYMYYDFESRNYLLPGGGLVTARPDFHTVKFGVNYRFNWGAPVIARY